MIETCLGSGDPPEPEELIQTCLGSGDPPEPEELIETCLESGDPPDPEELIENCLGSGDPPEPEELIEALQQLENAASSDAEVRSVGPQTVCLVRTHYAYLVYMFWQK